MNGESGFSWYLANDEGGGIGVSVEEMRIAAGILGSVCWKRKEDIEGVEGENTGLGRVQQRVRDEGAR